ncbi:MAG TPA: response regulator, partial [Candidatus Acidoferrales bacterium]|nr:response regulator [Candidatus Acidoferrales bacterium]
GGEWRAAGEPERLRRMFTNYLENALRYSPAGTVVTVGVEEDGGFLRAFVDDQGPGLPEGVTAANLFRLFGKGKGSTGKAGLGLYFCKITAERWGGSVGCRNRSGGGTRFWFSLPRAPGAAAHEPAGGAGRSAAATASAGVAGDGGTRAEAARREDAAGTPQPSAGSAGGLPPAERRLRILVADDIPMNLRLTMELLERRGHEVVAVGNGRAAVAAARERPFDVLLLDVQMPGMDGLEAARAIRAGEIAQGRKAAILAFTANDLPEDREQIRQAGMDGQVVKPFDRETLYRTVERAAGSGTPPSAAVEAGTSEEGALPPPAPTGEAVVARFGGDARLAAQLARMFLKDSLRLLGAVRRAAARAPGPELARTAHALKGAVGHFGAQAARQAAARLEDLGKRGERKGVRDALAELSAAVEALRGELRLLAGGTRTGAAAGSRKAAGAKGRKKRRAG